MFRRVVAPLMLGVFVTALTVQAEPASKEKPVTPPASVSTESNAKELLAKQQDLARKYKAVTEDLLTLVHRFEKSQRIEDQDKAKLIRKAIELGEKESVDNKFQTLLCMLAGKNGTINLIDVKQAQNQNRDLVLVLQMIYDIINNDDELARIKEEKARLEALLADLKGIIRETQIGRAKAESGKANPEKLAKEQAKTADNTDKLAKKFEGKEGDPKKDGMAKDGMAKDGMAKDGMAKDGMAKDGMAKDGMAKDGMAKDKKDGKDGKDKKDGKDGKDKKDGMTKDGKDKKDGMSKDGMPKDGKPMDGMPKDGMPKDGKPMDGKPMDGKPMDGKPMDGMPKDGDGDSSDSPPPPPKAPGAEQVRKAVPDQEQAKQELEKKKPKDAVQKETDAIDKLKQAQAELEKRLKQLREEELERLLANLEARVAKMLQMQIDVYNATKSIDAVVQKTESKKPEKAEIQKSQIQADKESEIIGEANKAIDILKQEGSAVAFPRIFEETVIDMTRVRERLNQANVGDETQVREKDIIDSLKEMLDALKKAQQELQQQKGQPPPPPSDGPPPDQKLLDEIAELKMLRNLQVKVNDRTKREGTVKDKDGNKQTVEQVNDPQHKIELKDLANRQIKIEEMARDIATGKNK